VGRSRIAYQKVTSRRASNASGPAIGENGFVARSLYMCGIVGYLNLNGQPIDPGEDWINAMCHSIAHRGPDEEGKTIIGPVALGMTRLSIIDLSTGQQPIPNEDKSIWIVFNGEIYNFHELQKLVLSKGHKLHTSSDTEVIVHLYEEFGVDCLKYLEGMFAFAIWDINKQRLFIARDRMGEKPLHYGVFDGQLIFGSELKGILAHPKARAKRDIDPIALQKYLAMEYVAAPSSIFKGIEKLMPSHYLLVENGQLKTGSYWTPKIQKEQLSESAAEQRLVELLDESTKLRLISDVPLGVFLSGGIDSSIIAALASRARQGEKLKTFSVGFTESSFDESEHAKLVSDHLGTEHHVAWFTPELARETLEELWEYLDEPLADASIVPTFFLSKMTREHVKVALAGEGGDELFGGYPTYTAHRLANLWTSVPAVLRRGLLEPAIKSLPVSHDNLSFDYKAKRFISAAGEPAIKRHFQWMGSFPLREHPNLMRSGLATLTREDELYSPSFHVNGDAPNDVASRIMQLDLTTYLPDDLLVKSDRASMAASLEVRLPFLAYPLVEYALSMPTSLKIRGMKTKYLLRKAAEKYLPESIIKRPKKGFGIPVAKWMRGDFKPMVDELLSKEYIQKQGLFDAAYIGNLLEQHETKRVDRRKELWTLFMFQWWWRKFFDSRG
jgi:asparagine synthase (glutamine-hydrolysing)